MLAAVNTSVAVSAACGIMIIGTVSRFAIIGIIHNSMFTTSVRLEAMLRISALGAEPEQKYDQYD